MATQRSQLTENQFALLVMKASCTSGCIRKFIASRPREVVASLCPALLMSQLEYCVKVPLFVQQRARNWREPTPGAPKRGGLGSTCRVRRGWESWVCSAWRKRSNFRLQLPKGGYGGRGLFLEVKKTRCGGHKLQQGKFGLGANKDYLPWR